jgi:2-hydroxychromene-2-carboxylate isomerase
MIEFCFDFVSPYAYLAWTQLAALGARVGRDIEARPVLFAGLLNAHGTKGPAEVPAKRAYVFKDVLRAAHRAGVTVIPPPAHPFNPLLALRIAGLPLDGALRARVVDALFVATWAGGDCIDSAERISTALGRVGIDAAPLLAQATTAEAKDRLRRNTADAITRGAFGVPTLFVDGEMFFGSDSFPYIEAYLRGEDPVARHQELLRRWLDLPAAANRAESPTHGGP